jgi:hypothetical protein
MKKLLLSLALCIGGTYGAFAQGKDVDDLKKSLELDNKDTVAWVHSGIFTFGANEGFLHNWAAGGDIASLTVNSAFHGNITRLYHTDVWSNNLDLNYGLSYSYSNSFIPRKSEDRIDFTSKYGKRIDHSKDMYFSALFNGKTQFTKGYDYSIDGWEKKPSSNFMSPAYLTLAVGAEYRKGNDLSIFFSPLAAREVLASSYYTSQGPTGAFGIDSGKTSKFQFGAYTSTRYRANLSKAVLFTSRLDLYCNYIAKDTKDASGKIVKKDNPGNIQCFWDNLFVIKAYKALSLTFGLTLFYDNNFPYSKTYIDQTTGATLQKNQPGQNLGWIQINQVFSFGLAYKF